MYKCIKVNMCELTCMKSTAHCSIYKYSWKGIDHILNMACNVTINEKNSYVYESYKQILPRSYNPITQWYLLTDKRRNKNCHNFSFIYSDHWTGKLLLYIKAWLCIHECTVKCVAMRANWAAMATNVGVKQTCLV